MGPSRTANEAKSPFLPPRWVISGAWKVHRALYRWSGGRLGLQRPTEKKYGLAQLETTGRRSGLKRHVMIGYFEEDGALVTMAMNGWGAPEPAWWLNLQTDPQATITTRDGSQAFVARSANADERERLWARWAHYDKHLEAYAARRPTETAVVIFDPVIP